MTPCFPGVDSGVTVRHRFCAPFWSTLAAVIVVGTLSACGPSEGPAEFRIGLLAMTDPGYLESSGRPSMEGAEMAAAEINDAGGVMIDGRPHRIRIIVEEYQGRPDAAASGARALLNRDSVHVLVGPQFSGHAIPVSVIAEGAGVPMISPMSSNPETTRGKDFVSRLAFLDDAQGTVVGRYAVDSLGAERAAVLYDESSTYSRSVAATFVESFRDAGGTVVVEETYTEDQRATFDAQLRRIRESASDVLLLPNVTADVSLQMREARALGVDAVFLGSDHWDLRAIVRMPEGEGAYVTHQWSADVESRGGVFAARYEERYGARPRSTAAMTYDAVKVLATAATRAGTLDGARMARSIRELRDYVGATGPISFSGSGDPSRGVALATVRGGQVESLGLIQP